MSNPPYREKLLLSAYINPKNAHKNAQKISNLVHKMLFVQEQIWKKNCGFVILWLLTMLGLQGIVAKCTATISFLCSGLIYTAENNNVLLQIMLSCKHAQVSESFFMVLCNCNLSRIFLFCTTEHAYGRAVTTQCFSQKGVQASYGRPLLGKIHSKFTSFKKITRNMPLRRPTFNFWLKASNHLT